MLAGLSEKGHKLESAGLDNGEYNAIAVMNTIHDNCEKCKPNCLNVYCISAVSDGRKGGIPDGL